MEDRRAELEQELEAEKLQDNLEDKYLAFYLDKQLYGIAITGVIEIQKVMPTTSMPELPYYVKGIINLRGDVLPIVDINVRFGRPEKDYTDRTCFVIVDVDNMSAGVVVDEVAEVVNLEEGAIKPPPVFGSGEQGNYVTGVAQMDAGMLLILDLRKVLSEMELGTYSG